MFTEAVRDGEGEWKRKRRQDRYRDRRAERDLGEAEEGRVGRRELAAAIGGSRQ